jgi:hypothetical protein
LITLPVMVVGDVDGDAHAAIDPAPYDRAVLEEEERAEGSEREEEDERRESLDAGAEALEQRLPASVVPDLASSVELDVPPAPRSFTQPSILSTACEIEDLISADCS